MSNLAIIGAGSWGTALAIVLSPRFPRIRLWVFEPDLCERMLQNRVNDVYLPDFELPKHILPTSNLAEALDAQRPLVCVDEASKQLVGEVAQPLPPEPGQPERFDYEYTRNGTANLFMISMPLLGWRPLSSQCRKNSSVPATIM